MNGEVSPLVMIHVAEPADMESVERCRFDVYRMEGYIDPADFPNGRERDNYDNHAISVIASTAPGMYTIGTSRLILNHDNTLPVQDSSHHNIDVKSGGKIAEVSRLCVRQEYRNAGKIKLGLYRVLCHLLLDQQIDTVYIIVDEKFMHTLNWLGFPFEQIGPPREYMGLTIPCSCLVQDILPSLRENENAQMLGLVQLFEMPFTGKIIL
ncbi:MAG: GNAT family N-acyltransferase [Candidatus Uhrbacteria bacterium]|nr:GNAT family N-acyltransferase [Candidatus Uhrbacteria bacterium]